jgi:RimJ/RimL family protein N-acetyltransferase
VDLRLEPLSARHSADLTALIADPDVLRFTRIPVPVPPGFVAGWVAMYEDARRAGTREGFAAFGADGEFLGMALAPAIDREAGEVELGYMVAPAARGRGVATAMLRQLTDWAFAHAGAQRIALIIDVRNGASRRVAERCGYTLEGTMRSIHLKQDQRVDAELWSKLPSDG